MHSIVHSTAYRSIFCIVEQLKSEQCFFSSYFCCNLQHDFWHRNRLGVVIYSKCALKIIWSAYCLSGSIELQCSQLKTLLDCIEAFGVACSKFISSMAAHAQTHTSNQCQIESMTFMRMTSILIRKHNYFQSVGN